MANKRGEWDIKKIKCPDCGLLSSKHFVGIDKNLSPYWECKCGTVMDENGIDKTKEFYNQPTREDESSINI